jgi:ABC-type amino acid transport substrate-binding protein
VKEVDLFIAFSNDISPLLVARWRSALKAMQQDGTFQSIYEKWYPGAKPPLIHLDQ